MQIPKKVVETVEAKYIRIHAKLRDEGNYTLLDPEFKEIAEREDGYVPRFLPYGKDGTESNMGDYLDLWIDLETGRVVNWPERIDAMEVAAAFGLIKEDEE